MSARGLTDTIILVTTGKDHSRMVDAIRYHAGDARSSGDIRTVAFRDGKAFLNHCPQIFSSLI
jgi:hypothetical protein